MKKLINTVFAAEMQRVTRTLFSVALVIVLVVFTQPSAQAALTLTFEGLQDLEEILDFYNGGTGGLGNSGDNLGISFAKGALALKDSDEGGSGNFANEPSADTIAFFLSESDAPVGLVMNYAAGFDTGFSFYYTSDTVGLVTVYTGLNATGAVLGTIDLTPNVFEGDPIDGDPTGYFDTWTAVGVAFGGIAKSVSFDGAANRVGFDNITLFSDIAGKDGATPEPASVVIWSLLGVAGLTIRWRRNRKVA